MDNSKIFNEKYPELLEKVKQTDMAGKLKILGIQKKGELLVVDFFNGKLAFDGDDFFKINGEKPTSAVKVLLCTYFLMCPATDIESSGKLVTFREFDNAGPLLSRFTENTGKIIQTSFSNKLESLRQRSLKTGGTIVQSNSYDLCVRFMALPKIPIVLNYNDADDIMPASAGFLYHDTAEAYLDLQCLTITCTYLTGLLINNS